MKTFAILLVGIAVAVRAAQLQLDNVDENGLEGIYRPTTNTSNYYFKFQVAIEKDTVVSSSEIILTEEVVPFISLKVPLLYKNKRVIDHMREKILLAARRTAALYNQTANMPPFSELIASYNDLADEMNDAISDKKGSQVLYMIMYHSTIIGSAFRIVIGAQEDWEICEPSPRYTKGSGLFICQQDERQASQETVTQLVKISNGTSELLDGADRNKRLSLKDIPVYDYCCYRRCTHCYINCCSYWYCTRMTYIFYYNKNTCTRYGRSCCYIYGCHWGYC